MAWIQTYTGKIFDYENLQVEKICLEDIAHSLSLQCRYLGHAKCFFSVAQHSVNSSYLVPDEYAVDALLHDAAEAFTIDIPRPLKYHLRKHCGPCFDEMLFRIEALVAEHFSIEYPLNPIVKFADNVCFATEVRDILNKPEQPWDIELPEPDPNPIVPVDWKTAKEMFLARYYELTEKRRNSA